MFLNRSQDRKFQSNQLKHSEAWNNRKQAFIVESVQQILIQAVFIASLKIDYYVINMFLQLNNTYMAHRRT